MPTYDYCCGDCQHQFEVEQKMSDAPLRRCPKCHRESLRRGPGGGIGLHFAGNGWYKDGYGGVIPLKA